MRTLIGDTVGDFRVHWKELFLADVVYKVIAFVLLTPLVGILFRVLIAVTSSAVLADEDILFFFFTPVGWLSLITVGALWLGIIALELATLMAILAAPVKQRLGLLGALKFAGANAWPVARVSARLIAYALLVIAPFLILAAIVYFTLLAQYDINYYLREKPPVFYAALSSGIAIALVLLAVLLRLFTGWFYALPLVLFDGVRPGKALLESRERAHGHRRVLLLWILVWALATTLLSALASGAVIQLGRFFIPRMVTSFGLTIAIGMSLLLWAGASLVVSLLSTTFFASMHFHLYRRSGGAGDVDISSRIMVGKKSIRPGFRLTRTRLLIGGFLGVAGSFAIGAVVIHSVRLEDDVVVIAHRGASKKAPENTLAAVKQAIEDGADWVEIDVQETADGKVVLFHDSDFMKTSGRDLKIWDATMNDLKEIDVGSWFDPKFKNERVPTLDQVLAECKGKVNVNIELKYYGHDQQLEQRVAEIVEANDMVDSVVIMSLKMDGVKKMKALRPNWKVGFLMSVSVGNLRHIEADFLAVRSTFATHSFIRVAHANGKEVYVWTVNDALAMSALIGRGVDGLITDRPALARSVLKQRARMTATQRLFVTLAESFGIEPDIGVR